MSDFNVCVDGSDVDITMTICGEDLIFSRSFDDRATAQVVCDRVQSDIEKRVVEIKKHAYAAGKRRAKGRANEVAHWTECINTNRVGCDARWETVKGK